MKIFGLVGRSGSGKTTLMERLLPLLRGHGLTVSTVKHAHHGFDIDKPGKDSWRHREAGAEEVLLISGGRWALLHEVRDAAEPTLEELLPRLAPVDLVLVEGYKRDAHAKLEVFRRETGQNLIQPGDPLVRAVATDAMLPPLPVPVLDLNNTTAIADFILGEVGLGPV